MLLDRRSPWQADAEGRSLVAAFAVGFNRAAVHFHRALLIAKPSPRPPNRRVIERFSCSKALKTRMGSFLLYSDPAIVDFHEQMVLLRLATNAHATIVRRELDGVLR